MIAPPAAPARLLAQRLAEGETLFSAWCGLPHESFAATLAGEAFDAVTLDMQHGTVDLATAWRALPLIHAGGKPALARIPVGEFQTASRLYDAGFAGVIAPMVNSVDDARAFASFAKFPPMGGRSWGPHGARVATGLDGAEYLAAANGFTLAFAMIETREALAALPDILDVPGIDGVFVGPADLSIALSEGGEVAPMGEAADAAMVEIARLANAAGKVACAYAHSAARAHELSKKGYRLLAVESDTAMLRAGARAALAVARGKD